MKGLRNAKVVREIGFEGVWADLEADECFRGQSFMGYLRLALVFV